MKLNCKSGDLAVIVRSTLGNLGKIVRVRGPYFDSYRAPNGNKYSGPFGDGVSWIVECEGGLNVELTSGPIISLTERVINDSKLRPIRDQPGDDETLTWAGLPQDQGVTA